MPSLGSSCSPPVRCQWSTSGFAARAVAAVARIVVAVVALLDRRIDDGVTARREDHDRAGALGGRADRDAAAEAGDAAAEIEADAVRGERRHERVVRVEQVDAAASDDARGRGADREEAAVDVGE